MAGITKHLGIAIADADAGRITHQQLLEIFQDAIDNGDILDKGNEEYAVTAVFPLIDAGVLQSSIHIEAFERRMNSVAQQWLQAAKQVGSRGQLAGRRSSEEPETIESQADTVGRILHDYIAIHDDIFGGGFVRTLRRMIPIPGIFQAIAFDRHGQDLGALAQELQTVTERIGVDDPPAELAGALAAYCHALTDTLLQLERISRRLAGRKDDPGSYTEREYKADLTKYEEVVIEYRSMGERVNRAFRAPLS